MQLKKIVVLGPESTGKSSLCAGLAAHYNTIWVKEFAREYLLQHGTDYTFDDLLTIANGQLKIEDEGNAVAIHQQKNKIIIDTDMYVMKVWSEFVFNRCNNWILNRIVERKYDLYLLANIDLPWVKDELREFPDLATREQLFHHYKEILESQNVPWGMVSGVGEDRLQNAISIIDEKCS